MYRSITEKGRHFVKKMTPRKHASGAWLTAKTIYAECPRKDYADYIAECLNACRDAGIQQKEELHD